MDGDFILPYLLDKFMRKFEEAILGASLKSGIVGQMKAYLDLKRKRRLNLTR